MRVTGIETIPIALPFREEYVTARGRLTHREIAIVRLHTDEGPTGLGEAVALSLRGGSALATIVDELEGTCGPALQGAELTASEPGAEIAALLARCEGVSAQTRAAVDLALHDLAGKLTGAPVWELLGAERAAPVLCNGTLVAGDPNQVATQAAELVGTGLRTLKLKAGTDADVETVRAVRDQVGPEVQIRIDANGVWSVKRALTILSELEPVGLELVEQPTEQLEAMASVRDKAGIPVVADESVASLEDAWLASGFGACDAATLKLAKVGGIGAALEIAAVLPAYLSSALDGPIGIAAAAHLAQALPSSGFAASLAHGLATSQLFAVEPATSAAVLADGSLTPPPGPGFGVMLDDAAIESLRI
jgi:L-alanine-DL-glutamate epimerase-like enolase superfamily enzyme